MTAPLRRWRNFATQAARIWALSVPYFRSGQKWRARGLLAAIVLLNFGAVYMLVQLNEWNRAFYDSIQNKQAGVFWAQLWRFCALASIYILIAVYRFYLTQLLELRWREWMTAHYLSRWLADNAFYRLELARYAPAATDAATGQAIAPDNPDQRIQEDLFLFTRHSVTLSMGLMTETLTVVSFIGILWGLSGSVSFELFGASFSIPGFMVWLALLYCIAGSVVTYYVGRPQIALNYRQQRFEADFRHHMTRVREYSEAIALDRGARVERAQLDARFSALLANYLGLIRAQKKLLWFTTFFGQAAVVFPLIVSAPRFFAGAIQLGVLMQIVSAFNQVQESLSWFVDNYPDLAAWRATAERLTNFEAALALQSQAGAAVQHAQSPDATTLATHDLKLALPDGSALLPPLALSVALGERVLVQGPSGSGKSTLFRALARIWPFAQGEIALPAGFENDAMFVPQHPYFPNGPLRAALAYPQPADTYDDAQLKQALRDALLPHLAGHLDDEDAWGQKLSGGEQQRLALARVLLRKPRWIFIDEATSALDEAAEKALYQRLLALVQETGGALISIAHRPGAAEFHDKCWQVAPPQTPPAAARAGELPPARLPA